MLVFSTVAAVVGIVAGAFSWFESKDAVDEFFDTYQMALARNLASADWNHISPEIQKQTNRSLKHIHNADDDDDAIGFAVFDLQGRMVFDDNEKGPDFQFSPYAGAFYNEYVDGDLWRVIRVKSADNNFIIAVGQELEYRSDIAWDLTEEFMAPWIWGLLILLAVMLLVIIREFRPLRKLVGEIKNRRPEDLSPLPSEGLPAEITPLVNAVNGLLCKIETMLQRERRFVADAAHELRTPLTALQVQLEVLQMSADDREGREKAAANLSLGLQRAGHLVEQLLALSRLDVTLASDTQETETLDWRKIIAAECEDYSFAAEAKGISVVCQADTSGPVRVGNPALISMLVKNLLENAVKYSPAGAEVRIFCDEDMFKIVNGGARVDEEHLAKLGQRFYRPSGQNEKGSGLGLSIVKSICNFYGCVLSFKNTESGFCVMICPC